MSTDPTKQPAPPPEEQADTAAPPTVQAPAQPAGRWGQEPPTMPVPQWPAAPPPPPGPKAPPPPGPKADRPAPQPTQWDAPAQQQRPTFQQRPAEPQQSAQQQPTRQAPQQPTRQAPQQWQQPQSQWQQEPQDTPPPQWSPQPPQGQWPPAQPPVQPPAPGAGFPRRRKRKVRRSVMALFAVIVIVILLVIGDRVALAVTENQFASQFQKQGFPVKPSVSIDGFPFLTQLAAKDFNKVDISADNVPAGPVTITSLHATINGMHISSFSSSASAKVDKLNATAFISFGALAAAGGLGGTGITVTQDGPDKVKITAGVGGVLDDTEEAQITQTGPQTISIKVLPSDGALGSILSSFGSYSFSLPKGVPASLRITGLTLNSQGLNVSASATNATFSQ